MLLQRKGLPEISETVMCTVKSISGVMVTVTLDEYENKSGLIHISEISPGRIRNIRDYVKEGKKIVCKVLTVNKEKRHIDLSLRRVSESVRREKVDELKHEKIAEGIIETVVKTLKLDLKKTFEAIFEEANKKHDYVYPFFEETLLKGEKALSKLELDPKTIKEIFTLINQRIKPPIVEINSKIHIESYKENGASIIREVFEKAAKKIKNMEVILKYIGSGLYSVNAKDQTFKEAEKKIDIVEKIFNEAFLNDNLTTYKFEKQKTKNK